MPISWGAFGGLMGIYSVVGLLVAGIVHHLLAFVMRCNGGHATNKSIDIW